MTSAPRHESRQVVNDFNLFVDSEQSTVFGHGHSKGDDVHIHMEGNSIEALDGEIIRVSLTNFTMFNNLYHVDNTNRRIRLRTNVSGADGEFVRLTRKNNKDLNSLASDFATVLGTALVTNAVAAGATTVASFAQTNLTPTATGLNSNGDRLFSVVLTAKNSGGTTVNHNLTSVVIQCEGSQGESYQLLGAKRLDVPVDPTAQSFDVTVTAQTVEVKGFFPMQRMSDPYVYLRCENVSNGLEMSVLDSKAGATGPDVINSNILAKVFRDVEFISYHTQTEVGYFINLQQRRLSHLHLFLTDSKGRRLGRRLGDSSGTAAGRETGTDEFTSNEQNTLGNLYFTAVLKVEVLRVRNPAHLDTVPPPFPQPAREAQSVMTWPDYGRPRH